MRQTTAHVPLTWVLLQGHMNSRGLARTGAVSDAQSHIAQSSSPTYPYENLYRRPGQGI